MNRIPRIVHQTWKTADLPDWARRWAATWRRHHPTWEHRRWTDAEIGRFVREETPGLLPLYEGLRHPIQRVDLARYLILHRFGGVFADLDCECLQPMDTLFDDPAYAEAGVVLGYYQGRSVDCACMASAAGHAFWLEVIEEIRRRQEDAGSSWRQVSRFLPILRLQHVLESTGPLLLSSVAQRTGQRDLRFLPPAVWFPRGPRLDARGEETYVVHHSRSSWMSSLERASVHRPYLFYSALFCAAILGAIVCWRAW